MFALGISPKTFLHSLIANHNDRTAYKTLNGQYVETAGFHCDIDHLVVEVPFVSTSNEIVLETLKVYRPFAQRDYQFHPITSVLVYTLRGPPARTA